MTDNGIKPGYWKGPTLVLVLGGALMLLLPSLIGPGCLNPCSAEGKCPGHERWNRVTGEVRTGYCDPASAGKQDVKND